MVSVPHKVRELRVPLPTHPRAFWLEGRSIPPIAPGFKVLEVEVWSDSTIRRRVPMWPGAPLYREATVSLELWSRDRAAAIHALQSIGP